MFGRRYRRKHFFPFWIFFAIFFFGFLGKSGLWAFLIPLFLVWCCGPMFWGLSSRPRRREDSRDWKKQDTWAPPQWQTPTQPKPAAHEPVAPVKTAPVRQPLRSMAGLPTTCAACGGPVNATTIEWRTDNRPHCGYCGTNLK